MMFAAPELIEAQFVEMLEVSGHGIEKRIKRLAPYLKEK